MMKRAYIHPIASVLILSDSDILTASVQEKGSGNSFAWNEGEEC